jgi:hypothetical protein
MGESSMEGDWPIRSDFFRQVPAVQKRKIITIIGYCPFYALLFVAGFYAVIITSI